jgi:signal transduction histidine kinase
MIARPWWSADAPAVRPARPVVTVEHTAQSAPRRHARPRKPAWTRIANASYAATFAVTAALTAAWLLVGLAIAGSAELGRVHAWLVATADGAQTASWARSAARGLLEGAADSYPAYEVVLDYFFSVTTIGLAVVLLKCAPRVWTVRLLALALTASAASYNLQAHSCIDAAEKATGFDISWWHLFLFHGIGGLAYVFALLMFPDGRLDWGQHRRVPARIIIGVSVVGATVLLSLSTVQYPHTVVFVLFFGALTPATGIVAQLGRYSRAPDAETRQQSRVLLWALSTAFALAVGLVVGMFAAQHYHLLGLQAHLPGVEGPMPGIAGSIPGLDQPGAPFVAFWLFRTVLTLVPCALLVGILKFRLWDIDLLFNRTIVYGILAALTGILYAATVIGVDRTLGLDASAGGLPHIIAITVVASVVHPIRTRIERWADRLVYGRRPAPYDVVSRVAGLAKWTPSSAPSLPALAKVAAEGLGVKACAIRVDSGPATGPCRVFSWPGDADQTTLDWAVPLSHRGRRVGEIAFDRSDVARMATDRRSLLDGLVEGFGLLAHNAQLELGIAGRLDAVSMQADAIERSRHRMTTVYTDERRDLERNLHDGAQAELVVLRMTLGLAAHAMDTGDDEKAKRLLDEFGEQVASTASTLEQLAGGLYPELLVEQGVAAAIRNRISKSRLPVAFTAGASFTADRYRADVEAALCFGCLEAVQNAVKHGDAASITVRLESAGAELRFTVADRGPGFDPSLRSASGGLQNLSDRLAAVGGSVDVWSEPGLGTRVTGSVPARLRSEEKQAGPGRTRDPLVSANP